MGSLGKRTIAVPALLIPVLVASTAAPGAAVAAHNPTCGKAARHTDQDVTGYVEVVDCRRTHGGARGDAWTLVFVNHEHRAVRYRACVRWLAGPASRCWSGTAAAKRQSRLLVARFVNDHGGTGPWMATWMVAHRQIASWRFTVDSEGV